SNSEDPNNLCIYLDQNLNAAPVLTVNVNLSTLLSLGTGGTAYVGFTGATGGSFETQLIEGWAFTPTVIQPFNLSGPTSANFTTTTNGVTTDNELTIDSSNTNVGDPTSALVCYNSSNA